LEFLHLKNEPQRAQSFKIYLCETLRKPLRSLRLNKKVNLNCVTSKKAAECWADFLGSKDNCTDYFGSGSKLWTD